MANLFQPSINRQTNSSANPASLGRMYFYATGTTTAATWYRNQEGTTAGTNPNTADANGVFPPAYLDPETTYRVKCVNAAESETIFDIDPVRGYDEGMVQTASQSAVAAAASADADAAAAVAARAEAETASAEAAASAAAALDSETQTGVYAAASAAATTLIYADTTAGLAGTASGSYFYVKGAGDTFASLWLDNAGVAVDQSLSLPSVASLANTISVTTIGVDTPLNIPLEYYPDHLELVLDENGDSRIRTMQSDNAAYPTYFGGAASAFSNIGTGSEVYAQTGATGTAELRSLVGVGSISVSQTATEIQIEDTGVAADPPTEYVVIIVTGQSNATESGGTAADAEAVNEGIALQFMQSPSRIADLTSEDDEGWRASFMPSCGKRFNIRSDKGVIFVNKALGGTAMHADADTGAGNWSDSGTLRGATTAALAAAKTFLDDEGYMYQIGGVLLVQGERDAQAIDTSDIGRPNYKTALESFVTWVGTAFGSKCPLIIARTGMPQSGDTAGFVDVREVQMEVCDEQANVFMGWTGALRLPTDNLMDDDLHYDQEAKNRMGKILGSALSYITAGIHTV